MELYNSVPVISSGMLMGTPFFLTSLMIGVSGCETMRRYSSLGRTHASTHA